MSTPFPHPVIRILALLCLTLLLPWLQWPQLLLLMAMAVFGVVLSDSRASWQVSSKASLKASPKFSQQDDGNDNNADANAARPTSSKEPPRQSAAQKTVAMLLRLKWFWLALFVLYGWLQPGVGWFGIDSWWMPSTLGLLLAAERCLALALLVVGVALLQHWTPREELLASLLWLGRPFAWLGVNTQQIALRLILTMEFALSDRDQLVRQYQAANTSADDSSTDDSNKDYLGPDGQLPNASAMSQFKHRVSRLAAHIVSVIRDTEIAAINTPIAPWYVPVMQPPNGLNWLLLVGIVTVLLGSVWW